MPFLQEVDEVGDGYLDGIGNSADGIAVGGVGLLLCFVSLINESTELLPVRHLVVCWVGLAGLADGGRRAGC